MHPLLRKFEEKQTLNLKRIDNNFKVGDKIIVKIQISEKNTQSIEGVVIGKRNKGIASSFTVFKDNDSSKFTMMIPSYLQTATTELIRQGRVRRAKLYYLQTCSKKKARIKGIIVKKKAIIKETEKEVVNG